MFPSRYFADCYFAPRYFPKVGAESVPTHRNTYPGRGRGNDYAARSRGNAFETASRGNTFAVVKHSDEEGGA